jgi:hypothetical protein
LRAGSSRRCCSTILPATSASRGAAQVAERGNVDLDEDGPGSHDLALQGELRRSEQEVPQLAWPRIFEEPFTPPPHVIEHHEQMPALPVLGENSQLVAP